MQVISAYIPFFYTKTINTAKFYRFEH